MARNTVTLSADTAGTLISPDQLNLNFESYKATIAVYGGGGNDFGGGTVTLHLSPDGGTTLIPIEYEAGGDISFTDDGVVAVEIPGRSGETDTSGGMGVYAVLTGSTSPTIQIIVEDNQPW